ncbi:hypothetical protein RGUI_0441 [Rhodovulum sp. P5]|uniref:ASCH domain-containing protein n=1 Tax=Rhodovulum sp. P5 TaxID=1564506 RepID=UPI0009C3E12E|nr:ASCH domain-containing protein [Rhodovulum sp. P5]ARE38582.1 hypothetical protein RGUI_0441 [Rhodovulum sp. P5]
MTLDEALERYPGAFRYKPGENAERNADALALMRAGKRTAACAALADVSETQNKPEAGRIGIALDWTGNPVLATRTLAVEELRYCDIDETHVAALAEYEDLADWRRAYGGYFRQAGGFDSEMEMIFVSFEVIEDFEA